MPRDDDEDDRHRRRGRDDDDEENDDRPRQGRRDDYDDEDEDFEDDRLRGRRRLSRETLHAIAFNQKAIILCILVYLILVAVQFAVPEDRRPLLALALIPLGITATVFVFLLATKVYSTGMGVLLGILTLIPCVGLIVLLIINAKATNTLKSHGIHVGLLGASSSDI